MTTYYTYVHHAGYGRDDHMASEIIARAARQLGGDTSHYIAAAVGFASHSVPMGGISVRLPVERGTRQRMLRALRAAKREVLRHDCLVEVECRRETRRVVLDELADRPEEWSGRRWREETSEIDVEVRGEDGWRPVEVRTETRQYLGDHKREKVWDAEDWRYVAR